MSAPSRNTPSRLRSTEDFWDWAAVEPKPEDYTAAGASTDKAYDWQCNKLKIADWQFAQLVHDRSGHGRQPGIAPHVCLCSEISLLQHVNGVAQHHQLQRREQHTNVCSTLSAANSTPAFTGSGDDTSWCFAPDLIVDNPYQSHSNHDILFWDPELYEPSAPGQNNSLCSARPPCLDCCASTGHGPVSNGNGRRCAGGSDNAACIRSEQFRAMNNIGKDLEVSPATTAKDSGCCIDDSGPNSSSYFNPSSAMPAGFSTHSPSFDDPSMHRHDSSFENTQSFDGQPAFQPSATLPESSETYSDWHYAVSQTVTSVEVSTSQDKASVSTKASPVDPQTEDRNCNTSPNAIGEIIFDVSKRGPGGHWIRREKFTLIDTKEGQKWLCKDKTCGRLIKDVKGAPNHWRSKHYMVKAYSCSLCEKQFIRRDHTKRHLDKCRAKLSSPNLPNTTIVDRLCS